MEQSKQFTEEQQRLKETYQEIEQQLATIGDRYYGDDFTLKVLDARREERKERLQQLNMEPYFGRLDFLEAGHAKTVMPLYIGKRGMERSEDDEPYVIDWRAPVASLFYSFTGGDEAVTYDAPEGPVDGEVYRKRNLSIRERELQRVVDSYERGGDNLNVSDEFLVYRLGEKKDNRLRDIVSTIQAEQDKIIRASKSTALIIQGAAGSGKTTVALHRLAYLLYQYQGHIRAEKMIIFAPNAMFLDYISEVLPELGVGHVRQTIFADWVMEALAGSGKIKLQQEEGKAWFSLQQRDSGGKGSIPAGRKPLTRADERITASPLDAPVPLDNPNSAGALDSLDTPGRFKGSLLFKQWIDNGLEKLADFYLPTEPFEAWPGTELSIAELVEWYTIEYLDYPLAVRRERLVARLNRWLEMRLAEVADPKVRKERAKTGKQRLRAYAKKLTVLTALDVYRGLFDSEASKELPEAIMEDSRSALRKGNVKPEDLAPLMWIHLFLYGKESYSFDHVVIDEAQDFSPFQVALLRACMNEPSFTILGDLAQGIHDYRGIRRWEDFFAVFPAEQTGYFELRQSYRSTLEIIEFANRIIPFTETGLPPAVPVFRSGDPVAVEQVSSLAERIERIRSFLTENRERGMRTMAIIGRSDEDCADLSTLLQEEGIAASLITETQHEYQGGVSIVPVYLAKGLEFDAVLLIDADAQRYRHSPQDAKLLYVGCTRALHRLTVLYEGELSPLIV
ncbi:DNA helicase UvrD [Paenibacillaceae bacterium]|nr:DNA helicase UvrD [Paenibacillaceae bacterium]